MEIFENLIDKYSFIIELLSATFLLTMNFKAKKYWYIPLIIGFTGMFLLAFFNDLPHDFDHLFLCGSFFVLQYLLAIAIPFFAFEGGIWMALFCANVGYCIQNLTFNTFSLFTNIPVLSSGLPNYIFHVIWFPIVYTGIFLFLKKFYRKSPEVMQETVKLNLISVLFGFIFIVFVTYLDIYMQFYMQDKGTYEADSWILFFFLFVFNMFILYIQFMILHQSRKETEANHLNLMLSTQKRLYGNNKELIENINIKCHDLKHQLRALNGRITNEEAENMAKMINLYDANLDTKNEAINVILAEKNAICSNRKIKLSCMMDGTFFEKMNSVDIYSLFGNLLDNAIDAVSTLPEEKRYISITQKIQGDLMNLRIENYCSQRVREFKEGLPQTDKDQRYHGFGTKSIRHLIEKYGGEVFFEQKDQTFIVNIIFDQSK